MTLPKNILHWSVADVAHWLEESNFQSEVQSFRDHQIDGRALTLLCKSDIGELISRIGPRVKFRAKLAQLTVVSRNIIDSNDAPNKPSAPANSNINGNVEPKHGNQRYNLIHVYPNQQGMPYVKYRPLENGIPQQLPAARFPSNAVKPRVYQNIKPASVPQQPSPYNLSNGPAHFVVQQSSNRLQASSFKFSDVNSKRQPPVPNIQSQSTNSPRVSVVETNSAQTSSKISDIEIKREKVSPVSVCNETPISPHQKCANEHHTAQEGRDNVKRLKLDNVQCELANKSTFSNIYGKHEVTNSNNGNSYATLSSEKTDNYKSSTIDLLNEERHKGRSSVFQELTSTMLESDKDRLSVFHSSSDKIREADKEISMDFRDSSSFLSETDKGRSPGSRAPSAVTFDVDKGRSSVFREPSGMNSEADKRQQDTTIILQNSLNFTSGNDKNKLLDSQNSAIMLAEEERLNISKHYQNPDNTSLVEKRSENDSLESRNLSPASVEDEMRELKDKSSDYTEFPSMLMDEERRQGQEKSTSYNISPNSTEIEKRQLDNLEYRELTSRLIGDDGRKSNDKLATYRNSPTLVEGDTRQLESSLTYRELPSMLMMDEERRQTHDKLSPYRDSLISSEGDRRKLGDSLAYGELPPISMDEDIRNAKEKSSVCQGASIPPEADKRQLDDSMIYREMPSMLMDEDGRLPVENSTSYRVSPVSSEEEKRLWSNDSIIYGEAPCHLTEEEKREMDEDLELYSNSSSNFDQMKDSGGERMIELGGENEHRTSEYLMGETYDDKTDVNHSIANMRENYERSYYNFINPFSDGAAQQKYEAKRSIDYVTNRLAVRERAKIFRRSEKKWHVAVNETAYQLALKEPKLLQNKKELRMLAEAEVRKTYRFAKGKSRSIAIPENRILAEERKKQKLTKDKINELKRQLNNEGEELSRQMRQCHMNLTLAGQQSDVTKNMQLREKMQLLNKQQAKLHFKMDELLSKERKLNLVKTGVNHLEHKAMYEQQNAGPYTYLPATVLSTVPVPSSMSQLHMNDPVHIVQLSSQENLPYVTYNANINVIN